jgi:hypothetical protein
MQMRRTNHFRKVTNVTRPYPALACFSGGERACITAEPCAGQTTFETVNTTTNTATTTSLRHPHPNKPTLLSHYYTTST